MVDRLLRIPYLFIWIMMFLTFPLLGQDDEIIEEEYGEEYFEDVGKAYLFDINFSIVDGKGKFGDNLGNVLPGFSFVSLWQLQEEKPSFLGFKVDYMHHHAYIYEYTAYVGPDLVEFDSRTSSNMVDVFANYRFFIPKRFLGMDPYLDALLGTKMLYTYTNDVPIDGGDGGDFSIDRFTVSPSYGVALGVHIPIKNHYYINARTSFLNGLSAGYWVIDRDPGFIADSRNAFLSKQTPTNLIQFELGMAFLY